MSAPAGWFPQPDGSERYWDGGQWTDHSRAPATPEALASDVPAPDPTAPGDWDAGAGDTQALDVSRTTSMPTSDSWEGGPAQQAYPTADPSDPAAPQGYPPVPQGHPAAPQGHPTAQAGYPASSSPPVAPGYGPPPPRRSSGAAKGCLIAALVGLVVLVLLVVGGIFLFARTVDQVTETFPSGFPSEFPTDFPSELPTTLPSEIPTDGGALDLEISVGDGFDLPRGSVQEGWRIDSAGLGAVDVMAITDMRMTPTEDNGLPTLFTMSFEIDDSSTVETVCTALGGPSGQAVDVSCVPLFGDVENARRVTVTSAL